MNQSNTRHCSQTGTVPKIGRRGGHADNCARSLGMRDSCHEKSYQIGLDRFHLHISSGDHFGIHLNAGSPRDSSFFSHPVELTRRARQWDAF